MTVGPHSKKEFIALGIATAIWGMMSPFTGGASVDPLFIHHALIAGTSLLETSLFFVAFKLLAPSTLQKVLNAGEYIVNSLFSTSQVVYHNFETLYERVQMLYQEYLLKQHFDAVGERLSVELTTEQYPHLANEVMEKIARFTTQGDTRYTHAFMGGWDRNRMLQLNKALTQPKYDSPFFNERNPLKRKAAALTNERETASETKQKNKSKRRKKDPATLQMQPVLRRSKRLASKAQKRKADSLNETGNNKITPAKKNDKKNLSCVRSKRRKLGA